VNDTMPVLNEKLIDCVLNHIEHNKKDYYQNDWIRLKGCQENDWCGTQACFAGWTVLLTTPVEGWHSRYQQMWRFRSVSEEAQTKLGLTVGEAEYLFNPASGSALVDTVVIKHRIDIIKMRRALRRPL
jgi:hypothetical protein